MILSLSGVSGSRHGPSSIALPAPWAHHCFGLTPLPMNITANRFGNAEAAPSAGVAAPQTGIDSSHGSAIVTPTPRRNVRLDALMVSLCLSSSEVPRAGFGTENW